jgi:hypothetical protein
VVTINPSKFVEDGGVLDLSLSEIVSLYSDLEKNRFKSSKDDENQQEDKITCRVVPMGLMMAIDGNARRLGTTRAMLTRCMSHQIAVWLDSLERIQEIVSLYNIACDAAEEYGYPDLYDAMTPNYGFASASPRSVSFRTIRWVKNKMFTISQPLGVTVGSLYVTGLCYSLTRAGNETKGTIN